MRDRWDGNRGACDSWHDGDVEVVGWRARGQSGVVKQSQSVGVYKETTPQVGKSHVRWVLARWRKEPQKRQTIPNGVPGNIVTKRGTNHV